MNGHLSDWFYLQRGCRQGDPLSPYLFICAEILATLIRHHDVIKGITICIAEFLISQYADDTSFILYGSRESLDTVASKFRKKETTSPSDSHFM